MGNLLAVKSPKRSRNRDFALITYLFMAIFILMIAYFIYFMAFKSEDVINSAYNPRVSTFSDHVIRGDIISQDGVVLATTNMDSEGNQQRVYPYNDMFAHVVGYAVKGNSGVEASSNFHLLRSHSFLLQQIYNDVTDEKSMGDTVVTTLDFDVQEVAYEALGNRDGAVVVLEVETGKILGMVSKPDFDPNTIGQKWEQIIEDNENAPLLNRASQGLYPPGSTFKVVTALEFLREKGVESDYAYTCEGVISADDGEIHCAKGGVHGNLNLTSAFAQSCNTAFSAIGSELNITKWQTLADQLLFNQQIPSKVVSNQSKFTLDVDDEVFKVMQTAIGQGDTLVTPLHMAQITAAIANDGKLMESYVVDSIQRDNGSTVKTYRPTEYGSIMSKKEAQMLQTMMEQVVQSGTGTKFAGQSYNAAGKTGTAEYTTDKDQTHAWYIGYGSKDGYKDIAIAVIVEGGGSGSSVALPVAKEVFDVYFNQDIE